MADLVCNTIWDNVVYIIDFTMTVAVVIATYNGERFLREQLDSVLAQTLLPSEIIIQDDNSKDGTWDILVSYQRRYPDLIRLYRNEHSLGAHGNFINAFQYVTSDYIAPCDQDDIWMPEKLESLHNALSKNNCSLVACKEWIRYENGEEVPNSYSMPSLEDCIFNHSMAGHLMMVPRNVTKVFEITNNISFDFGMALWAACENGGLVIDYYGCVWRRHSSVITTAYSDHSTIKIEDISKWRKLAYTLKSTMKGKRSLTIYEREFAIHQIIAHFAKDKKELCLYDRLALNMMKQTPIGLLRAGIILGKIKSKKSEYHAYSLKDKIANRLFNLCYPAVFWYDFHMHNL